MRDVSREDHLLRSRTQQWLFAFLLIFPVMLASLPTIASGETTEAYLFITPVAPIAKEFREVFDISVCIMNAQNLCGLEFTMIYNSSLLGVVQVRQGDVFPGSPRSEFMFENNQLLSSLRINISLADSEPPRSGNGTLAIVAFKVIQYQSSCCSSPITFSQILLLDDLHAPILHDSCGAVFFWKSILPDPPIGGRLLDLHSQRGGVGPEVLGGHFVVNDTVRLISEVEYCDSAVQQKLIAFEVINPQGQIVAIRVAKSGPQGLAEISLRIPDIPESVGTWTVISTADIAGVVVWDVMAFQVHCVAAVGGYSSSVRSQEITAHIALHIVLLVALTIPRTIHSRRNTRRHRTRKKAAMTPRLLSIDCFGSIPCRFSRRSMAPCFEPALLLSSMCCSRRSVLALRR